MGKPLLPSIPLWPLTRRSISVTVGIQLASAITTFLGLRYSQLIYMGYVMLSSAMACKAFRMVLLCDTTMDPLNTLEIGEILEWEPEDGHLPHELVRQTIDAA